MHSCIEHRLCFLDNIHCFFDFPLSSFVALRFWFDNRYRRMIDIQNAMIIFSALKTEGSSDAFLLAELEQETATRCRFR